MDRAFSMIIEFYALQVSINVTRLKIAANLDNLDRGKIPLLEVLEEKPWKKSQKLERFCI